MKQLVAQLKADPWLPLKATVPQAAPLCPYVEARLHRTARALTGEAGQTGQAELSEGLVRTAIIVALCIAVVGGVLYQAIFNTGVKVGADIEAAGSWGG